MNARFPGSKIEYHGTGPAQKDLFIANLFAILYFTHVIDLIEFFVFFQGNLYPFIGFSPDFYATVCTDIANLNIITVFQVYF
jgi:hypothetical protein